MALPKNRWRGIWWPRATNAEEPFMALMIDALEPTLRDALAYPTNDYENQPVSILPLLAYQGDAFAFDPNGSEIQQRNVLAGYKLLHTLVGTEAAFDQLMAQNNTRGFLRYVGDYDSNGSNIARAEGNTLRPLGTHSRHTDSPIIEDTLRDGQGRPLATVNPQFVWDNEVYHKFVEIDIIKPPDRPDLLEFIGNITRAAIRTVPYTLEVLSVNITTSLQGVVGMYGNVNAFATQYVRI